MEDKQIWLSEAIIGQAEKRYIAEALDNNQIYPSGRFIEKFRELLVQRLQGDCHIELLNSGTAALHLALLLMEVGPTDEVICQDFTFIASVNAILYTGARPILVDSEPQSWNISPEWLEVAILDRIKKVGRAPKAVMAVHLFGMPAKMDEIREVAHRYGVRVIEDAAEALGSTYKGVPCGRLGDIGTLSFNANKIITTGGGGAIVSSNPQTIARARYLSSQAKSDHDHYHYWHTEVGYSYQMNHISAAIGCGQLTYLDDYLYRRREVNEYYFNQLLRYNQLSVMRNPSVEFSSNYWLTTLLLSPESYPLTATQLVTKLRSHHIDAKPLMTPLHLLPLCERMDYYGDNTALSLYDNGLCIPSSPSLTNEDQDRIISLITSEL